MDASATGMTPAFTVPGDGAELAGDVTVPDDAGATIKLIVSLSSSTGSGLSIAAEYAVDTVPPPAQIISISFGACEQAAGISGVQFWDSVFSQGAAEGISAFVSSGDAGVAGCATHGDP